MATQDVPTGPLKVFLWANPRAASTAFLKCMTFVPDAVAWHEPYLQIAKFSLQIRDPLFFEPLQELLEKHGGVSAVAKIESGYDASDKNFDWLKEQLEGDFPGKRLVFVKELGVSIERKSLHDKIPKGFRHTFLIRSPRKVIMSILKQFKKQQATGRWKYTSIEPDNVHPSRDLNELWKYVKAEGIEPHPIIIDADELLENPKEMMEAYCKEVGIPFTEDLLTWEAGDDVMTKQWMVPKQTILTFDAVGLQKGTFASTGFKQAPAAPLETSESSTDQLLPEFNKFMEAMKKTIPEDLPYYEELFAERLTLNKQ